MKQNSSKMNNPLPLKILILIIFTTSLSAQIYVDINATGNNDGSSWENAYVQLSDAIDIAVEGDEIWVATGTYKPGGLGVFRDTTFFLTQNISLYGGFEGTEASLEERGEYTMYPTILSGDADGNDLPGNFDNNRDDNCRHVLWADTTITNNTVIDGFFIQGGQTDDGNGTGDDRRGGGLLAYGGPIIQNCTFRANYGYFGGGAYPRFGDATNIRFENCEFLGNQGQLGAALYINSIDKGVFTDCLFEQNVSESSGGAIYNQNSIDSFVNCSFVENLVRGDSRGGAMYCVQSMVVFENCDFNNNEAASRTGGAIHFFDDEGICSAEINNCRFLANRARWGGAITAYGTNTDIFTNNSSFDLNESSNAGGAISVGFQSTMNIDSCFLEDNISANVGGAIFLQNDSTTLLLSNTSFTSNIAEDDGGAIYTVSGSDIDVIDCFFESNTAALGVGGGFGGAISFSEDSLNLASLNIERTQFLGNFASDQGGAINLANVDATITNSLFVFNVVGPMGIAGAISNNGSASVAVPGAPLLLVNNTFSFNEGGFAAGVVAWEDSTGGVASVSMQNNIFYHPGFEDLAIEEGEPEFISLGGNLSGNASAAMYLNANTDIVGADPMFIDPGQLEFNITSESPCKDAGVNDGAPLVDIRGIERDDSVDIGCYEEGVSGSRRALRSDVMIEVFPTISNQSIYVNADFDVMSPKGMLYIYNSNGVVMHSQRYENTQSLANYEIQVGNYPPGLYYVRIVTETKIGGNNFIKVE